MTDLDSVERFQRAIGGFGRIHQYQPPDPAHKLMHIWSSPRFEHTQAVLAMLWPGLNARRRRQFAKLMRFYKIQQAAMAERRRLWRIERQSRAARRRLDARLGSRGFYGN